MSYNHKEVIVLMTYAFNAGFNKYETVEAGLEGRETDSEVRWILLKFDSEEEDKFIKKLEDDN